MSSQELPQHINQLSHDIIGCAIEVHKQLGPGLLESVYEAALCHELDLAEALLSEKFLFGGLGNALPEKFDSLFHGEWCGEVELVPLAGQYSLGQVCAILNLVSLLTPCLG